MMKFSHALSILFLLTIAFVANAQNKTQTKTTNKTSPATGGVNVSIKDVQHLKESDTIPFAPEVRYGKLSNGFTYYIMKNSKAQKKVFLRLVVKTGNFQEDPDQIGTAHLVEHMAFRSTKNFPNDSLDRYMISWGIPRHANYNAYTGNERTVYILNTPTNNETLLSTSLQAMRDWAQGGMLLTDKEIELERKILMQEMMLSMEGSSPAESRVAIRRILAQPACTERSGLSPEDEKNGVSKASHEAIRRFYKDWYRPDLEGLMIIGDMDVNWMEQKVKALFADMKNPTPSRPLRNCSEKLNGENKYTILTDQILSVFEVQVYMRHLVNPNVTYGDFRTSAMSSLLSSMIKKRMNEIMDVQPGVLLWNAFAPAAVDRKGPRIEGLTFGIRFDKTRTTMIEQNFKTIFSEIERLNRFGFAQTELEEAKATALEYYRSTDAFSSEQIVTELLGHFLNGDALPTPAYKNAILQRLTKDISLEEVNKFARECIMETDRDITILAPEEQRHLLPSEASVLKWNKEVKESGIKPHQAKEKKIINFNTLYHLPEGGKYKRETIKAIGVTELKLANGVNVVIKTGGSEKILLHGFSEGGALLYPDQDFYSTINAGKIIQSAGVGEFTKEELTQYMIDNKIDAAPYIDERDEGIKGSSSQENLEILLQLVYRYFTVPNKSEIHYKSWIQEQKAYAAQTMNHVPDTLAMMLTFKKRYPLFFTTSDWDKVNIDRAFDIYKERFNNAGDFTFVITGVNDIERSIPLLVKYLGSLRSNDKLEVVKDWQLPLFRGKWDVVEKNSNLTDNAQLQFLFVAPYNYSVSNNTRLELLAKALDFILKRRIREREGGTYSLNANVHTMKLSPPSKGMYRQSVLFGCDPVRVDELSAIAWDEINDLKLNGPSAECYDFIISAYKKSSEATSMSDFAWLKYLALQYLNKEDPAMILERADVLKTITREEIKKAANEFLTENCFIRYVQLPGNGS